MHETGCSVLVHWDDPEGWDGEGGGGVQDGEHMYTRGRFLLCGKTDIIMYSNYSLIKINKFIFKKKRILEWVDSPTPGDIPNPRTEPTFWRADSLPLCHLRSLHFLIPLS